jgi:hypothetical protein
MDSIIKVEAGSETHFIVVPHIHNITISSSEDPRIIIQVRNQTLTLSAYDLPVMDEERKSTGAKYERDSQEYAKIKNDNIKNINDIAQELLEPHLTNELFRPQKSLLPYRGAKVEVVRKFSSFIFNCLNYFWSNFGEEGKRQIASFSVPPISEADQNIEHIFESLMKGVNGFDVAGLFIKDFIQTMLIKSYESCKPVIKPIESSYRPDKEKCLQAALMFVETMNNQIHAFYAAR